MTARMINEQAVSGPLDVRTFLLGEDSVRQIADRLRAADLAGLDGVHPGHVAQRLLREQFAASADSFLSIDVGGVAITGWRKHAELVRAARATSATPGLVRVVEMLSHAIRGAWRPRLEVIVEGAAVATISFQLDLNLEITALSAVVARGRLMKLGGGAGRIDARFSTGGQPLATRSAAFDPSLTVRLGSGVPLLADDHLAESRVRSSGAA